VSEPGDAPAVSAQGRIEIHVDPGFRPDDVTRVTLEAAGRSTDLFFNSSTDTFDGLLSLPSGGQTLVARAFAGETLIGESSPLPVTIEAGVITRVLLRILDIRPQAHPLYSPIFQSLSFPTTVEAGAEATFAISVIAPGGDPVSYSWDSTCFDSTFTDPNAATTTWSNPRPELQNHRDGHIRRLLHHQELRHHRAGCGWRRRGCQRHVRHEAENAILAR